MSQKCRGGGALEAGERECGGALENVPGAPTSMHEGKSKRETKEGEKAKRRGKGVPPAHPWARKAAP